MNSDAGHNRRIIVLVVDRNDNSHRVRQYWSVGEIELNIPIANRFELKLRNKTQSYVRVVHVEYKRHKRITKLRLNKYFLFSFNTEYSGKRSLFKNFLIFLAVSENNLPRNIKKKKKKHSTNSFWKHFISIVY